jgi:hypothetical protein
VNGLIDSELQAPNIYIPQKKGGPVIFTGTDFPFRRLLRRAGLPEFIALAVLVITSRNGPHRKHRFSTVACRCVAVGMCLLMRCLETVEVHSSYLPVVA